LPVCLAGVLNHFEVVSTQSNDEGGCGEDLIFAFPSNFFFVKNNFFKKINTHSRKSTLLQKLSQYVLVLDTEYGLIWSKNILLRVWQMLYLFEISAIL